MRSIHVIVQLIYDITVTITEPGQAILHFKNTRKPGFACIVLLSPVFSVGLTPMV